MYHVSKGDNTDDLDDLCDEFDPDERHSVREVMSIARDFLEKEDAEMCSGDSSNEHWPTPTSAVQSTHQTTPTAAATNQQRRQQPNSIVTANTATVSTVTACTAIVTETAEQRLQRHLACLSRVTGSSDTSSRDVHTLPLQAQSDRRQRQVESDQTQAQQQQAPAPLLPAPEDEGECTACKVAADSSELRSQAQNQQSEPDTAATKDSELRPQAADSATQEAGQLGSASGTCLPSAVMDQLSVSSGVTNQAAEQQPLKLLVSNLHYKEGSTTVQCKSTWLECKHGAVRVEGDQASPPGHEHKQCTQTECLQQAAQWWESEWWRQRKEALTERLKQVPATTEHCAVCAAMGLCERQCEHTPPDLVSDDTSSSEGDSSLSNGEQHPPMAPEHENCHRHHGVSRHHEASTPAAGTAGSHSSEESDSSYNSAKEGDSDNSYSSAEEGCSDTDEAEEDGASWLESLHSLMANAGAEREESFKAGSSSQAKRIRERRREKKRDARVKAQKAAKKAQSKLQDCVDRETLLVEEA